MSVERLQKVLASAGVASRRDCEELIAAGRVAVNGKVVRVAGTRVDPATDEITVDGQQVGAISPRTYVMLHKPVGVVSTTDDPQGRQTVVDLVEVEARLFPVGRLDYDSEGLLLLTDDGELTQQLTHPSHQVEKEYRVLFDQAPSPEALRSWREGVELDGTQTAPAWVEVQDRADEGVWVRVVLHEGRKRQIREVARLLGYEVLRLIRVREGPLNLGDLAPGAWRHLTDDEVAQLREHAANAEARIVEQDRQTRAERPRRSPQTAGALRRLVVPDEPATHQHVDEAWPRRESRSDDDERGNRREQRRNDAGGDRGYRPRRDDRNDGPDNGRRDGRGPGGGYASRREDRSDRPNFGPRRDDRGDRPNFGSRREDRGGGYGPRREDRGDRPNLGPYRDDRPNFGPRREDRGDRPNLGPYRSDRPNFGPRREDRGGGYGPRREDRGDRPNFGPRREDRGGGYGPRRDDRGDRPKFEPRREDRGGYGPRREDRGDRPNLGPRRDDRGDRPNFGPRRDDRDDRPFGQREGRNERPDFNQREERPAPRQDAAPERSRPGFARRPPFGGMRGVMRRAGLPRPRPQSEDDGEE